MDVFASKLGTASGHCRIIGSGTCSFVPKTEGFRKDLIDIDNYSLIFLSLCINIYNVLLDFEKGFRV